MPTLATKTYTPTNGTANDGTPLNAELAVLFNNDDLLNTAISDIANNANFATATTLTLNSSLAGSPSVNVSYAVERGSSPNVSLRWNETTDIWEYTNDGTNFFPIGPHILDADPTPIDGQIWSNRTEDTVRHYNGTLSETLAGYAGVRANTGTTDTIVTADRNKVVTQSNASAVAVTLPQANSTGFKHNFSFYIINLGAGLVTITPSTSTINSASTLTLRQGDAVHIISDNTNYTALTGKVPEKNKVFTTTALTYAAAGGDTTGITHGLTYGGVAVEPHQLVVIIQCTSTDGGYSVGERLVYINGGPTNESIGITVWSDTTKLYYRIGSSGLYVNNKSTGNGVGLTAGKWDIYIRALYLAT